MVVELPLTLGRAKVEGFVSVFTEIAGAIVEDGGKGSEGAGKLEVAGGGGGNGGFVTCVGITVGSSPVGPEVSKNTELAADGPVPNPTTREVAWEAATGSPSVYKEEGVCAIWDGCDSAIVEGIGSGVIDTGVWAVSVSRISSKVTNPAPRLVSFSSLPSSARNNDNDST